LDSWQYSSDDLQVIDLEVDRLAMLCGLPLLQPSVIEAIVRDDQRVCLVDNRMAWEKLRGLLILHHQAVARRIESDARLMPAEFVRQGAQEVRGRMQPVTCSA
jgi:hypothetical protein